MSAAPDVFGPARLGPLTLRNRIIKAATFEARTPGALVTDDLIEYHRLPAAGGVGMTTVAYCAVCPGGRTSGNQIWMRPEAVAGLRRLTETIHAEGAAVSAQIGHAGPVADASSNKATALAPVRFFNPIGMRFAKNATRGDINDVMAAHANAARLAADAGFDAVEIHLGHNYLASSFLSPLINRRDDEFGGSLQNRAKVARGLCWAASLAMAEGFDFVAMARALLAEPDLINRLAADDRHAVHSACTHCNRCMPTIYSRTRCVVTGAPDVAGRVARD
jgi:2,4-dienoyl-CoA reductase-like NADH-dependent reductase (Old Yellow Enzyme family)